MGFIEGEARRQGTLFPVSLEEFIPDDHFCRVIDAFVDRLDMQELGFVRAEAAETGRPGYDPPDLLKLYLYGYLQQIRSSRRLEGECRRNVELMWLLGRLCPDHKSIAEFRRMDRQAVTLAGAELVQFARSVGLILFGVRLPVETASRWGILLVLGIQLYRWIHLYELSPKLKDDDPGWDVAWIGVYQSPPAKVLFCRRRHCSHC